MTRRVSLIAVSLLFAALTVAHATVSVTSLYSSNMVLQRNKPVPVWGRASANKTITVIYNGQTKTTTSDAQGNWLLYLDAMAAKTTGSNMTVNEAGANTLTFTNVVVGDVWICSGQSNMAFSLSGCNRQSDIDAANYPGIRHFWVPLVTSSDPQRTVTGSWTVCSPSTAAGFSAVAFYFGRKIYTDQSSAIPIGLIASTVGGTCIDPWLAQEGETDISVLSPLYSQSVMPWGPFSLANGMIHPLAPLACKGAIWYQGENRETTSQSTDSYFLKEKALQQGWKRAFGLDDFALYVVLLANYLDPPSGTNVAPDMPGTSWSDTRIQQVNVVGVPHCGVASAMDVGDAANIHPTDKLDVGERLAFWALKNDYGRTTTVPSGPILNNVTVSGNKATCTFDYVGSGLMIGYKVPYTATSELVGGVLKRFSIAGATGSWYDATATIVGATVELTSPSVSAPKKVAYACWNNPKDGLDPITLKEGLLYNRDGLPANPFYVDDATAKYTVTATAGSGGSISPTGTTTYLKRKTALYAITPDSGYYIQNVTVDAASVGAVKYYTFDPLYANHTISATFASTAPTFTVTSSSSSGGSISPLGAQTVTQGGSKTFTITPNTGCQIASVTVDGGAMGKRAGFTFSDVRANHTISATFACPITSSATFGGTISPSGPITVNYGSNQTFTIAPISGYSISSVVVDGAGVGAVSSYTFTNVITNHTISASFSGGTGGVGTIPQTSQIIFSAIAGDIQSNGNWSTNYPTVQSLTKIGTPTLETINGRKWEKNVNVDGDGYRFGSSYSSSIACTGASIVVAVRPARITGDSGNWRSIVDVFYDRMVLGLMNDTGLVNVRRNGSLDFSSAAIPDGQITILSLVAQSNGTYKVWANGTLMMSITSTSDMTALVPGVAGTFANYINVGRNNPDGWTTSNGNIGDVFLYKTALTDAERGQLEQYIGNKLSDYTITASAGAGGSISPPGATTLQSGSNQTYTIAPNIGYNISQVAVDGVNQGAISSYTFSNLSASHTISATFSQITYTITASAGANGSISPSGAVTVNYGANQTFTITPNPGYAISQVVVDGVLVGTMSTYTFYNVTSNYTIFTTFTPITYTITASAGANGSISPSGAVSVNYGTNKSFTITPNPGYAIANVVVDGVSQGGIAGYTFNNVTANHTISVTFAKPVGMNNKSVLTDANAIGKVVVTWGKVKSVNGSTSFVISDGYSGNITIMISGVTLPSGFDTTKTAIVTGVVNADRTVQAQTVRAVP